MPTSTLLSCFAEITLAIVPEATGLGRVANATIPATTATTAKPISIGTIGGSVHLALFISSDIGTWPLPRSGCGCVDEGEGGAGEAGTGLISSGIRPLLEPEYSCEMQDGRN